MIELKHIDKYYNIGTVNEVCLFKDFNLTVDDGDFISVIGSNGSGKTSMLNLICGSLEAEAGNIILNGEDISHQKEYIRQRKIGRVYQNPAMGTCPSMTILENMSLADNKGKKFGLGFGTNKKRVDYYRELLSQLGLGLEDMMGSKVGSLSGGQRQRVAMGRAIVCNPKVFLMDEPLSNLDAKLRGQMRIEISKLHQRLETTIIYVTHDQTEAMTLGTRIVVMNAGVIQQVDTPQKLYEEPGNMFVAGFIGSPQMNFLDAVCQVEDDDVYLTIGEMKLHLPETKAEKLKAGGYDGKTVVLGIRPEDVHDEQMFITSSPNTVIQAKIRVYEMLGAEVYLHFDYEGATMTARVDSRTTARTGDTVTFAFDAEKIHVFDKETEKTITN